MKKYIKLIVYILLISVFSSPLFVSARETWREKIKERWKERAEQRQQQNSPSGGSSREGRAGRLYEKHEKICLQKGWMQVEININGRERKILWKGPEGLWKNGAIITMHGGGGTYSNYCSNIPLGKPMVDFGELAISEGFAVFSPESTENVFTDTAGYPCGKRFDSLFEDFRPNTDLPFIEAVIDRIIPQRRPVGSSDDLFMTGISNGGYMTTLAATHFDDRITAFAPVSTGDPYGTHMDCSQNPAHRSNAPGIFVDNETGQMISDDDGCFALDYPREKKWGTSGPVVKPTFKQFQHALDALVDMSCMEKNQKQLVKHGYKDEGAFVIERKGTRKVLAHFWMDQYNRPMIDFFKKYANRDEEIQYETKPTQPTEPQKVSSGDHESFLMHGGLKRKFIVHVPGAYQENTPMPVVLAFHGGGGSAAGSVDYFQLNDKADQEGFIVVYPEGTGLSILGKKIGAWNAGDCCGPAKEKGIDDVGFVKEMIKQLKSDFNVDEDRIYATGMSNGAMMSYALACEMADTIAAIAPVGAHDAYEDCKPARPVPVMHFHGKLDPCAAYDGAEACGGCFTDITRELLGLPPKEKKLWACSSVPGYIEEWRWMNGCSAAQKVTFRNGSAVCETYQQCDRDAEVTLCTVKNMGHTWPGRTTYSAKACQRKPDGRACQIWAKGVGPLSDDINANDMMWEFFKRHPMN